MCMRDFMTEDIGYMSMDTFMSIFESGIPDSIKLNWRGEPLLHPDIDKMIRYAKEIGVHEVALNTNGQLLTREMIDKLSLAQLDWLIISIDGATKSTYETIRKGGDFETLYKNFINATLHFTGKIRVQICKQPLNEHEIGLWKELFKSDKNEIRIGKLHDPQGKIGLNKPIPIFCPSFWQRITVGWNGDILPCPSDYQGHWKLGNIESTTIREAWHSNRMNYFRHLLSDFGRSQVPPCKNCSSYC